jgi:uncharacterized metal-binding protein YceD (DUF177 family)
MDTDTPIQRIYDLGTLSEAGYEKTITASDTELARLAKWEGVEGVTRFEGRVTLKRLSQKRFRYEAELGAEVLQDCVVTLEPVHTQISRKFSRDLHYIPGRPDEKPDLVTLSAIEDETTEEIGSLRFDLAGPLLEEFSLAVDPYPRAPGVEFDLPGDEAAKPDSPFAVLKSLKRG